jgi:two-component system, chemotaxis family, chemotaxis protein CheY
MNILIIDDSTLMRHAIRNTAQKIGLDAIEARDGAEGLIQLKGNEDDISLIILDWNMPIMNGFDFLVEIRSQHKYDNIPILMATAIGVQSDVVKAIKAGVDSYIVKPFTPEDLTTKMKSLLSLDTETED